MRIAFIVLAAVLAGSCVDPGIVAPTPVQTAPDGARSFASPDPPVLVCITAPCPPLPPVTP